MFVKFDVGDILYVDTGFYFIVEDEAHREARGIRCFPGKYIKIDSVGVYLAPKEILIRRREIFTDLSLEEIKHRLAPV